MTGEASLCYHLAYQTIRDMPLGCGFASGAAAGAFLSGYATPSEMGTIQNSDVQLDLLSCKSEFLPWTPVYMHAITIDILQSSDRIKIQSHNGLQILTLIINVTG